MELFLKNANDSEILVVLKSKGLATAPRKLRRLNTIKGLRGIRALKDAGFQIEEIIWIVKEHLNQGIIGGLGIRMLQT